VGGEGIREISVPSTQFFCETEVAVKKKKVYFEREKERNNIT
jgi:hypothetical protein